MAERAQREPMSKVDTAWLRMERPTNLMMITGVLMFAGPLDAVRIRKLLADRFLAYRRFGQRAVQSASGAWWETDEDFDIDWHVRVAALPGARDKPALETFVSELTSTPLDHAKPLWQFHVVENYLGGGVLIARIHHCYADGLALVQVLLSLTDTAAHPKAHAELAKTWLKRDRGGVLERLLEPGQAGLQKLLAAGEKAWEKIAGMLADPSVAAEFAREGSEITRELAIAITLPDDPITAFKGPLGVDKRVAWAEPLPLDEVKTLGRAFGCTVNDVLLACAAGALRGYLRDAGDDVDGLTIRATVPVNLRPLEHAKKLGNHFGLVFLDLPIGEPNPLRRLERVAACMRDLKGRRQAIVAFGLLAALGMAPAALAGACARTLQPQSQRRRDERARAAAAAVHGRRRSARADVLGAADRIDRPGAFHTELQRQGLFRRDRRRQARARSGCDRASIRRRVREAPVDRADGGLGRRIRREGSGGDAGEVSVSRRGAG